MPESSKKWAESAGNHLESGRGGQIVGFLDVGDDLMGLEQRVRTHRFQAHRPVAPAGAGHADDLEFDLTAERMAGQRIGHPPADLLDRGRPFRPNRFEVHVHPSPSAARSGGGPSSRTIVGTGMVNGALRPQIFGSARRAMAGTETTTAAAAAKPSVRLG